MNDLIPEYKAAELLAAQESLGYGIWVKELCFRENIIFDTVEHYAQVCASTAIPSCEGCTVRSNGVSLVLYKSGWDVSRINYTLAHEVGHILLGHAGSASDESEANRFASALIVPFAPLRALGKVSPARVAEFFGCSVTAAGYAMKRTPVTSPYDERILSLYKERLASFARKRNPLDISCDL